MPFSLSSSSECCSVAADWSDGNMRGGIAQAKAMHVVSHVADLTGQEAEQKQKRNLCRRPAPREKEEQEGDGKHDVDAIA